MGPFVTFQFDRGLQRRGPNGQLVQEKHKSSNKTKPAVAQKEKPSAENNKAIPTTPVTLPISQVASPTINVINWVPSSNNNSPIREGQNETEKQKLQQLYNEAQEAVTRLEERFKKRVRKLVANGVDQVEAMMLEGELLQQVKDARKLRDAAKKRYEAWR